MDQGEQDPLVVHTSVSNLDLDWLGTVDGIVETMELAVAPGLVAIPLLAEDPQAGPAVLFSAPLATDDGAALPEENPAILDLSPVDITYPLDTRRGLVLVSAVADDPEDLPAAEKLLERTAPSFGWAE